MIKAGVALIALLILFSTPLPREIGALIIAALLLANRQITSRTMIATVDWPLLLLVACLFAITGQLNDTGIAAKILELLSNNGLLPNNLAVLLPFALVTSNAIGSVPAAMLVLQIWPLPPDSVLYSLALLSTLAGNLLLSGSLSTLLIAERAAAMGAPVSFREYARAGVPIALVSLAFASFWLVAIGILAADAAAGSAAVSVSEAGTANEASAGWRGIEAPGTTGAFICPRRIRAEPAASHRNPRQPDGAVSGGACARPAARGPSRACRRGRARTRADPHDRGPRAERACLPRSAARACSRKKSRRRCSTAASISRCIR